VMRAGGPRRGPDASNLRVPGAPSGAMIDYFIKSAADTTHRGGRGGGPQAGEGGFGGRFGGGMRGPRGGHHVVVTVTDAKGDTVSVDTTSGKMGYNRYQWGMRYEGPAPLELGRGGGGGFRRGGFGPRVVPGTYTITVALGHEQQSQQVNVLADPKVPSTQAGFEAALAAGLDARAKTSALNTMLNRIQSLENQLKNVHAAAKNANRKAFKPVLAAADSLGKKLTTLKDSLHNSDVQENAPEDDIHYLARFDSRFRSAAYGMLGGYGEAPRPAAKEHFAEVTTQLNAYLDQFNAMLRDDVAAYNRLAAEHHAPELIAGGPVQIGSK